LAIPVLRNVSGRSEAFIHWVSSGIRSIPVVSILQWNPIRIILREQFAPYRYGLGRVDLDRGVVARIEIATILFLPFLLDVRSCRDRAVERCHLNIFRRLESVFGKRAKMSEKMEQGPWNFLVQSSKTLMGDEHAFAGGNRRFLDEPGDRLVADGAVVGKRISGFEGSDLAERPRYGVAGGLGAEIAELLEVEFSPAASSRVGTR
jgi:hypothetical protein